ncbi:MAG: hypothetical protein ACOYM3_04105 [Terrimicrobiaceae bacterium]
MNAIQSTSFSISEFHATIFLDKMINKIESADTREQVLKITSNNDIQGLYKP